MPIWPKLEHYAANTICNMEELLKLPETLESFTWTHNKLPDQPIKLTSRNLVALLNVEHKPDEILINDTTGKHLEMYRGRVESFVPAKNQYCHLQYLWIMIRDNNNVEKKIDLKNLNQGLKCLIVNGDVETFSFESVDVLYLDISFVTIFISSLW